MKTALVIDDHPVVLQGCKSFLKEAGITDVHVSSTFSEGFRLYRHHRPDLIFLDLAVKSNALGGLSFLRRLRRGDTQTAVLIFSMHCDPMIVSRAIKLGATGYLLKDTWQDELSVALHKIRNGQKYLNHELASEIAFLEDRASTNPLSDFTLRELDVLSLVTKGTPYKDIASELNLSYKTIANTVYGMKSKLCAHSLIELVQIANAHMPTLENENSVASARND